MAPMTQRQKDDLDRWLTTPPEYPENRCPKCNCEIWDNEKHSEEIPGRCKDEYYFLYTCPDTDNCGHKWVENE